MRNWIKEITGSNLAATPVEQDNASTIIFSEEAMIRDGTRHINLRYHYSRKMIEDGEVKLVKVPTDRMTADALTKAVNHEGIVNLRRRLSVVKRITQSQSHA